MFFLEVHLDNTLIFFWNLKKKNTFYINNISQNISLCLQTFPCATAKFSVFFLSGKSRSEFPVFPVPWPEFICYHTIIFHEQPIWLGNTFESGCKTRFWICQSPSMSRMQVIQFWIGWSNRTNLLCTSRTNKWLRFRDFVSFDQLTNRKMKSTDSISRESKEKDVIVFISKLFSQVEFWWGK